MKRKKQESNENPEQIEYREADKDKKDAELRIALRGRGLDPYELSQMDFDELRRLLNKMQQVDLATKNRMNVVQQEGNKDQVEISGEIEVIINKVLREQHPGLEAVQVQPAQEAQPITGAPVAEEQSPRETAAPGQEEVLAGKEQEEGQEA